MLAARFAPGMEHHSLLLIDHRGIGASEAIDCPGLQHVQGDQTVAARECGASLGAAADRYGSGDVADDIDDVRAALGIDKIDYYGVSYGAVDVRAYAYRHADHLRSAVLDSPYNSQDPSFVRTLPTAMQRISVLVCERSPSCAAANPNPGRTFRSLVRTIQQHPVSGVGYDANGTAHSLVVDETALLGILYNDYFANPPFLNQGEIFAAATALQHGDTAPLLRLAAESPSPTDFGPSDGGASVGDDYAVFCSDSNFPWDKNAPEATREAQYQSALAALPANATRPFTPSVWANFIASQPVLLIPGADACVPWPSPVRPEPPFPDNQPFPANVPALLLGGGLDYLDINSERSLMPLFPSGKFVSVANAGHVTTLWNPCAQAIALRFVDTLKSGDTSCAADPLGSMTFPYGGTGVLQLRGVAGFPTTAADAVPGQPVAGKPAGSVLDRKVADVAWQTATDAIYRQFKMTTTTGRGLRGGTYTVSTTAAGTQLDLQNAQFTDDVAVSGQVTLDAGLRLTGRVTVSGSAGLRGSLKLHGVLWDPAHPLATISGKLGGNRVTVVTQTR